MPDNLRSGVTKAHRYEPDINPSYRDLAEHYGVAVLPARSRKPRDKAKVEVGVQVVERGILAALRNRQFSPWANSTRPSAYYLNASTIAPSRSCPARAAQPSRPSTNLRCNCCQNIPTSTPNGKRFGYHRLAL